MIIIRIFGGLGNQFFQYAAAKALAEHRHTELKLDVTAFASYQLRDFDLAKLNLPFSIATNEEIKELKATNTIERIKAKLTSYPFKKFYKEPFFHFDRKFFHLSKDVYLQGYFQSEKYFLSVSNTIKKDFDVSHLIPESLRQKATTLQNQRSVALHIRKGDYKNPNTLKVHGVLSINYYQQAVAFIQQKFTDARFYIFSDDPQNAMKELDLPNAVLVSGNLTKNHFEDFYLMSHCQHNIIANSSFSWWAAWLNNNPNKIVIAPRNWFNQGPKDTQDLLPENWIKL